MCHRWKDSSLGPACLTEEEKFRFHRAVHRLWAFQTAFGSAGLSDRNFASALPHSWLKPAQATFLDVLGNEELFEIKDILLFYTAYAQWVGSARNIGSSHSELDQSWTTTVSRSHLTAGWLFSEVMTTGPALLPQVASGANWYPSYNYSTSNAAQRTLDVLAKARGINDDRWGSEAGVGAIVRSTSGRAFQCESDNFVSWSTININKLPGERCNVSSRQVYGVASAFVIARWRISPDSPLVHRLAPPTRRRDFWHWSHHQPPTWPPPSQRRDQRSFQQFCGP